MDSSTPVPTGALVNNLAGSVFGHWTVLGVAEPKRGNIMVLCRCSCGVERPVRRSRLVAGGSVSCGCMSLKKATAAATRHNMSHSKEYRTWRGILTRTGNKNSDAYKKYGACGIGISDEWRDSFATFLADMGMAPSQKHSIDRIDNNRGYSKENCRWATSKEQQRNRRVNVLVTHNGFTRSISEWEEVLNIKPGSLRDRFRNKWTVEDAMTAPYRRYTKKPPVTDLVKGASITQLDLLSPSQS